MVKVSVIIPFYSHKEWLEDALESVFNQTYKNKEVIFSITIKKRTLEDIYKELAK